MMTRSMTRIAELEKENEKLKTISMMPRSMTRIAELEKENKRLKQELQFYTDRDSRLTSCYNVTLIICEKRVGIQLLTNKETYNGNRMTATMRRRTSKTSK